MSEAVPITARPPHINYSPDYVSVSQEDLEFSAFSTNLIRELQDKGFDETTALHSPQSIRFYKEYLGANENTISTLVNGHRPQWRFNCPPPPMYIRNNRSAREEIGRVRDQIIAWEEAGICVRLQEKPYVCSPLSLDVKADPGGNLKYRVCLDLKRSVNLYVTERTVTLDDMQTVLPR